MKVCGIRPVSFRDKKTNDLIEGLSVYYTFDLGKNGDGVGADKVFISSRVIDNAGGAVPTVGQDIDILYNKYGKVAGYTISDGK